MRPPWSYLCRQGAVKATRARLKVESGIER